MKTLNLTYPKLSNNFLGLEVEEKSETYRSYFPLLIKIMFLFSLTLKVIRIESIIKKGKRKGIINSEKESELLKALYCISNYPIREINIQY